MKTLKQKLVAESLEMKNFFPALFNKKVTQKEYLETLKIGASIALEYMGEKIKEEQRI